MSLATPPLKADELRQLLPERLVGITPALQRIINP